MKALSGRQPWWWAILHAGKRIENRVMVVRGKRMPPTWHRYRGPILLHAAKGCGLVECAEAMSWMFDRGLIDGSCNWPGLDDAPRGGIVGRARIVECLPPWCCESLAKNVAREFGADLRWWMRDQYGFVLDDVEPLPFRPWPGALGLFEVPGAA